MSKKSNRKRLNEFQWCEIIAKLSKTDAHSKRAVAREYDVSEGAIRKVWEKREQILERFALMFDEAKEKTFWSLLVVSPSLKSCFKSGWQHVSCQSSCSAISRHRQSKKYCIEFIDSRNRRQGILAMVKSIQSALRVAKDAASQRGSWSQQIWSWIVGSFRRPLRDYRPIWCENVYNMDETGLFFRLLPR